MTTTKLWLILPVSVEPIQNIIPTVVALTLCGKSIHARVELVFGLGLNNSLYLKQRPEQPSNPKFCGSVSGL